MNDDWVRLSEVEKIIYDFFDSSYFDYSDVDWEWIRDMLIAELPAGIEID